MPRGGGNTRPIQSGNLTKSWHHAYTPCTECKLSSSETALAAVFVFSELAAWVFVLRETGPSTNGGGRQGRHGAIAQSQTTHRKKCHLAILDYCERSRTIRTPFVRIVHFVHISKETHVFLKKFLRGVPHPHAGGRAYLLISFQICTICTLCIKGGMSDPPKCRITTDNDGP